MKKKTNAWIAMIAACLALAACGHTGSRAPAVSAVPGDPAAVAATDAASASAPAVADATAPVAAKTAEYRLGPGDTVKISVYNNPDLTTEAEISEAGRISFPLVGEVAIGGLTRTEAEQAISKQLGAGGFVPNAHVNMLISQYRSRQVAVMGEVNKPGTYSITKATSIAEMLAIAGGISPKGSHLVTVIQRGAAGGSQRYEFDVRKLISSGDLSGNALVDKDDIIFVPAAPVFYIYGEVRQPGAYQLAPDMTVRQALAQGGGLTVRGTERGIRLERRDKDNEVVTRRPHLDDKLRPNDVLHVPESWF